MTLSLSLSDVKIRFSLQKFNEMDDEKVEKNGKSSSNGSKDHPKYKKKNLFF